MHLLLFLPRLQLRHGSVHSLWASFLTQRSYASSRNRDTDFSTRCELFEMGVYAAALPCSSRDNRSSVWHISLSSKHGHIKIVVFYSSLVALLNLFFELETNQRHLVHIPVLADYWKLGRFPAAKPAPQHCDSLGWWGMHAKPVPWICLRTLEKIKKKWKKQKVTYTFLLRQKLKTTLSKTRIRMLRSSVGAILAKQYHHRVSSPLLCVLLHPSVEPKHIIGYTLRRLHKPHTK